MDLFLKAASPTDTIKDCRGRGDGWDAIPIKSQLIFQSLKSGSQFALAALVMDILYISIIHTNSKITQHGKITCEAEQFVPLACQQNTE